MKIKEIRKAIETLHWHRHDATGGTADENMRCDLPGILAPHIAAVKALIIAPRFERDIVRRDWELEAADAVLIRWHGKRRAAGLPEITN